MVGGLRTAWVAFGSFQNWVSDPGYSAFPSFGVTTFKMAVWIPEGAGPIDLGNGQKTEACSVQRNVVGYLTCEMHGSLL